PQRRRTGGERRSIRATRRHGEPSGRSGGRVGRIMNIFDLRGPEFLVLYIVLLVLGVGVAFGLRDRLRGSRGTLDIRGLQLQPFEVALLAEGDEHAVRTALAGLAHRELITAQG